MKRIFVAYADSKMAYSLKRIGRQARRLGIFDSVRLYTPSDLPAEIRSLPLMQYSYGGGYWAWKPWIILDALNSEEDALVCYVDAGCTLNKSPQWQEYLKAAEDRGTVLFQYADEMPQWARFGATSTKIRHWAKKAAIEFLDAYTGGEEWREHNKVLGGFIFARGKDNPIINAWLDVVMNHPEVIDDFGISRESEYPFFALHKHDQPLLTALVCKFHENCAVFPQMLDAGPSDAAVVAERIRVKNFPEFLLWRVKKTIKSVLGETNVINLKKKLRK